jgi:2-methylcitrate dehydratase PrpD
MKEQNPTAPPVARQLAEWALALNLSDVEPNVLERVKLHVLDQIGAQVSCRNLPTPRITQDYISKFGVKGNASILGTSLRVDAESAGFANATAGSSFEIDDYGGNGAYAHPGCVVVPSALAVSEEVNASGAEFLRAAAVGFETVIRLAIATMPSMLLERGFHQTGSHGVFAAALASSMLNGDKIDVAVNALSIAGSHASGTTEYAQTGGEVKRVHSGIGVAGGIRAARLARLGLTGPSTIFEGKRGFLQAFCNDYDVHPLYDGLGDRWHFAERGAIKPYASCGLIHHHFAAYDKLREAHQFAFRDIEEIVLGCEPLIMVHNGAAGPRPTDIVAAQFSAEYGMAMRIVHGRNDVGSYLDAESDGFKDSEVIGVAERVRLEPDDECASGPPKGKVTLRFHNGMVLSETGYALGSPLNPLSRSDIEQKYYELVSRDFGDDVAQRSLDLVMGLENVSDLRQITQLFEAR